MSSWFMTICNYNSTHHPHHRHHCISLPVVVASRHCRIRCQHMWRRTGGWTTERHRAGMMWAKHGVMMGIDGWYNQKHWTLASTSRCVCKKYPWTFETFRSHLPSIFETFRRFVVSFHAFGIFFSPCWNRLSLAMLRPSNTGSSTNWTRVLSSQVMELYHHVPAALRSYMSLGKQMDIVVLGFCVMHATIRTCTQLSNWGNPTAAVSLRPGHGVISLLDLLFVDSDLSLGSVGHKASEDQYLRCQGGEVNCRLV